MQHWHVSTDVALTHAPTPDDIEALDHAAHDAGAVLALAQDGASGGIDVTVEAPSAIEAATRGADLARSIFAAHGPSVEAMAARSEAVVARELERPAIPPLVGYAEVAAMAGVSRQRARQFADLPGFPPAVVETASGPLRLRSAVEAWVAAREPRTGRPPASAGR